MASISTKKREAGKLNKRCLTLDEKERALQTCQQGQPSKFKQINEILFSWFKKCEASGIYVNGPLLKEDANNIKEALGLPDLESFKASDGWLDKWKLGHWVREKQISGESLDVS